MTPERWQRIKSLSIAISQRPLDERSASLSSRCEGDVELEREVVALIDAAEKAEGLFETPAIAEPAAARALNSAMQVGAA